MCYYILKVSNKVRNIHKHSNKMKKRLSQTQQRAMLKAMPETRKIALKKYCRVCQQKGQGIQEIMKKVGDFLGPIMKEVGPKVLKEFLLPVSI